MEALKKVSDMVKAEMDSFLMENETAITKGRKASAQRARKHTNNLSKLFKDYRKASMEAFK